MDVFIGVFVLSFIVMVIELYRLFLYGVFGDWMFFFENMNVKV